MPPSPVAVQLTPAFKLIFLTVVALTLLSFAGTFVVLFATHGDATISEPAKQTLDTCSTTYKLGFGAIIGLIGGKVT